ncbi:MAG: hypothetical protein ACRDX9_02505 [Acidimicrobiia bacterium]
MTNENVNLLGLLGRLLTVVGAAWFAAVFLGRIGLLSELGLGNDFLAGLGGGIFPALLLLVAGRALRRRAKAAEDKSLPVPVTREPTASEKRVPTSRSQTSTPVLTPPRLPDPIPTPPVRSPTPSPPVPRQIDPLPSPSATSIPEPESPASEPRTSPSVAAQSAHLKTAAGQAKTSKEVPVKTSKQMLEEAHKKWGRGRSR